MESVVGTLQQQLLNPTKVSHGGQSGGQRCLFQGIKLVWKKLHKFRAQYSTSLQSYPEGNFTEFRLVCFPIILCLKNRLVCIHASFTQQSLMNVYNMQAIGEAGGWWIYNMQAIGEAGG